MRDDEGRARLEYSGGVMSRAKGFMVKTVAVLAGAVMLASAFVVSLAFFAFALAVALVLGGFIFWKTRDLRRRMREQMRDQTNIHRSRSAVSSDDVIEGVVISRSQTSGDSVPSDRH